jgi:hypothetical protein
MKRTVGALGLLGLVWAVSLPAANAAVLYQDDFSSGKVKGVNGVYIQAKGDVAKADTSINPATLHFVVVTDNTLRDFGWLDGGDSVGIAESPGDDTNTGDDGSAPVMLLTGDPKWADVAIQSRIDSLDQNTGAVSLVLRATPKTKLTDPDSRYELRYQSDVGTLLASEIRDGIPANDQDTNTDQDGSTTRPISMRLMKVVNGKWTMLAEAQAAKSTVHIPRINNLGVDHDTNKSVDGDAGDEALTGGYFRLVAKGDLLQGFVSLDGKNFEKVLEAHDSELKAGLVGFMHYDYHPIFKELLVEDAP